MAVNLASSNGRYNIFVTQSSWHRKENEVSVISTSQDAMRIAQLDYEVVKQPIYTGDGEIISGKYATVRQDNKVPLGVVGDKYTVLQNKDAFKFIDDVVGSNQAIFHSAGALGKGERIWLSCKLPNTLQIGNGDDVAEHYFFLENSHNGSGSVSIGFTQTFIVCENTVKMALSNAKRKQKIRHTVSLESNMFNAVDLMGITHNKIEELSQAYNQMAKVNITDEQLKKFIELAINPASEYISQEEYSTKFVNVVDRCLEYGLSDSSQLIDTRKGTLFGAFNAVTGYFNNAVKYDSAEDKLTAIMYGSASKQQENAFDLAMQSLSNQFLLS